MAGDPLANRNGEHDDFEIYTYSLTPMNRTGAHRDLEFHVYAYRQLGARTLLPHWVAEAGDSSLDSNMPQQRNKNLPKPSELFVSSHTATKRQE